MFELKVSRVFPVVWVSHLEFHVAEQQKESSVLHASLKNMQSAMKISTLKEG